MRDWAVYFDVLCKHTKASCCVVVHKSRAGLDSGWQCSSCARNLSGIDEFQSRNGPGLKVSVSKWGELFPCLLERTATAVGVGDGTERALLEVSRVALDRAMHKEEERRIDNGKKIGKPKVEQATT